MKKKRLYILFYFLVTTTCCVSQNNIEKQIDSLISLGYDLLDKNPSKAISLSQDALSKAKKIKYVDGQIQSLDNLCYIYYVTGELEKSIESATMIEKIGLPTKDYAVVASNMRVKACAYSKLGFHDEAIKIVYSGLKIAKKIVKEDTKHAISGALYQALGIVVSEKDENAKDSLFLYNKKCLEEFLKIKDQSKREGYLPVAYLNLSKRYIDFKKLDSAKICLDKSLFFAKKNDDLFSKVNIMSVLGLLYYEKKDFPKAIEFYNQSNTLALKYREPYIIRDNYEGLKKCYGVLNNKKLEEEYNVKFLKLNDSILVAEKASVKTPIKEIINEKESIFNAAKTKFYLIIIFSIFLLLVAVYYVVSYFKSYKKEKINKELKENELTQMSLKVTDSYDDVIHLAKKDDPLFSNLFKELYPRFYENLTAIQPDLTLAEQRFCFYLRLNFTTKEIAEYTFVTPKAVQNRKNRLRKRLDIPEKEDIYTWIEKLG